ncbi:MAG TPA: hypothetical protein VKR32_00225 [Puia sp.]|nr:hypothetical protein [Puia sp.]
MLTCVRASFFVISLFSVVTSTAQNLDNPGDYITAIGKAHADMDAKYMAYLSAAAHGRRAKKVEKLRQEVLDNINQCRHNTIELPKYKGDNSLRQGSIDYIQLCYRVFNEDYKKIVDVEDLVEQSVDEMQAYILLQQKVDEKLEEGHRNLEKITQEFAAKYHVNLIEDQNPLAEKIKTAGKLDKYVNAVYLLFYKCNWEDQQIVRAMNNKKVDNLEQSRNALSHYADDGLQGLDTLRTFDGDPSLANACRDALLFYKNMSENDLSKLTDFYLKEEEFDKMKKQFDAKSQSRRTKEDVDAYNKSIKDINASVNSFNQTNTKINKDRTETTTNWQNSEKHFTDEHMPHYK